jgi:hypothetical protein
MTADFVYRALTPIDIPSITSLVDGLYTIKRSPDFIRWQCFENVFPVKLIGGFSGNELAGMFGVQRRVLSNDVSVGQLSWINIGSKWRGSGLFQKLGNLAIGQFKNLDLICVFANSNACKPCVNSFGMRIVGKIKTMELDLAEFHENKVFADFTSVTELTKFRNFENNKIFFKKFDDFRDWRYVKNPSNEYYSVSLKTGEYIIYKIFVDPLTGKSLADFVEVGCSSKESQKALDLLNRACYRIKNMHASKVTLWALPDTTLRDAGEKIGFVESGQECYFVIKTFSDAIDDLYDFLNWDLEQSDATNY